MLKYGCSFEEPTDADALVKVAGSEDLPDREITVKAGERQQKSNQKKKQDRTD